MCLFILVIIIQTKNLFSFLGDYIAEQRCQTRAALSNIQTFMRWQSFEWNTTQFHTWCWLIAFKKRQFKNEKFLCVRSCSISRDHNSARKKHQYTTISFQFYFKVSWQNCKNKSAGRFACLSWWEHCEQNTPANQKRLCFPQ